MKLFHSQIRKITSKIGEKIECLQVFVYCMDFYAVFTHFFVEKRIFYLLKMKKLFGIFAIFCKKAK